MNERRSSETTDLPDTLTYRGTEGPDGDQRTDGDERRSAMSDRPTMPYPRRAADGSGAAAVTETPRIPGYTVVRALGAGTYGEVWEAIDDKLGDQRRVAIKCFTRHRARNRPMLRGEVDRLLKLSADSRIVRLYDVGWDHDPPYFVMEHLAGGSLAERLRDEHGAPRQLPADQATRIAGAMAKALAYLHANATIHCDVKPGNVLLTEHGQVRLADFGQARLSDQVGPAYGTLFYMPPEQVDPSAVTDVRVDIYALGAVLYEMLTGHPPYADSSRASEVHSSASAQERIDRYVVLVHTEAPPRAHRGRPGVDPALAEIVERCLAVDPAKRFQNVQQVRSALDRRRERIAQRPILRLALVLPLLLLAVMGAGGTWLGKASNDGALRALASATLTKQLESIDFVRRTIAGDLAAAQRRVGREAGTDDVRAIARELARPGVAVPRPPLPHPREAAYDLDADPVRQALRQRISAALDELFARYRHRGFYSWVLADQGGWIWARSAPTGGGDVVGRWFGYREWWSGQPQPPAGAATTEHRPMRRRVGLTAPFRSQARGNPILVSVAAPVWPTADGTGEPVAVLSASMSLDHLDLLLGRSDDQSAQQDDCPSSFITLIDRGALVRHPCADRASLPLPGYGVATGLSALADRLEQGAAEACACASADERTFGFPTCCHIITDAAAGQPARQLTVAGRLEPRLGGADGSGLGEGDGDGSPAAAGGGWIVAVHEDLDGTIAPIRRLGRRFTALLWGAVGAGLLFVGLLWWLFFRLRGGLSVPFDRPTSRNGPGRAQA